ncbi:M20 family peptidase [Hirschia maritima]|uniref:M20 family peptidase n=1 Tax=Hirschia maritima TaxID=1121961 RepID=UPI00037355E0|nr:M20 family peptidase [Hirschia maritima]
MIKKIGISIVSIIVLLLLIMVVRTLTFKGQNVSDLPALPSPVAINVESALHRLKQAVQLKTITINRGDPINAERAQPWLNFHSLLEREYPKAHSTLRREKVAKYSLLYTWQGSDTTLDPLMLMAHQDVVPVNLATLDDWNHPPFSGNIENGYIYGRGTQDDKASIIAILEAIEALIARNYQPNRTIHLLFGHDEEVAGTGAEAIVALLASRNVQPAMVVDEGYFVINDMAGFDGPVGLIGVAEKGYVTLDIVSESIGGHSSLPPKNSANIQLAKALLAIEKEQMQSHLNSEQVQNFFKAVSPEMSFLNRFFLSNTWLTSGLLNASFSNTPSLNAMIRTTTAPTMLTGSVKENVMPQRAKATVNFRIHPQDNSKLVFEHIERVVSQFEGVSVHYRDKGIFREPSPISPSNNKAFRILSALAEKTGEGARPVPALVLAGTDATFAHAISENVYRFTPVTYSMTDIAGIHGTNERLSVENFLSMIEGFSQLIQMADEM